MTKAAYYVTCEEYKRRDNEEDLQQRDVLLTTKRTCRDHFQAHPSNSLEFRYDLWIC